MSDRGRVLVVDDEANITDLVAMALRYDGFEVRLQPRVERHLRRPSPHPN
jgi:DNA-binding response OmpR family regulator